VPGTALHVAPHPDDEALGAPATLLLLRRAGFRVVNALVGLGRPADHARRRAEAEEAARRGGFELVLPDTPVALSRGDDRAAAEESLTAWLTGVLRNVEPSVVISPSPHDGHHGHEVVARATARALASSAASIPWWVWGLWNDLPFPTLYVPFDDSVLAEVLHLLDAYSGELARNDYNRLPAARGAVHAVLGSERVFGFGRGRAAEAPYAELLTELWRVADRWQLGAPRRFDVMSPLTTRAHDGDDVTAWIDAPSVNESRRGAPRTTDRATR
jgi:LmbE family N-acetylglucosaminyl deacetylase